MRTGLSSLLTAGAFAAVALLPATAAADGGLTVLLFASPPEQALNEAVAVDIEVYRWGSLVDADSVVASTYVTPALEVDRVSTGHYHASLAVTQDLYRYGKTVQLFAVATVGGASATASTSYSLRAAATGFPGGTGILLRVTNLEELGWFPAPGDEVRFEARVYSEGKLSDANSLTGTLGVSFPAGSHSEQALTFTRTGAGTFVGSVVVPSDLRETAYYSVSASTPFDYNRSFFVAYGSTGFQVLPVPAFAWLENVTATSAVVRVLAGSKAEATPGANVTAAVHQSGPSRPPADPPVKAATTDARGQARVGVDYAAEGPVMVVVNVTVGGRVTTIPLTVRPYLWRDGDVPSNNSGLMVRVLTDTSTARPGDTVELKVHLEVNGTPLYARRVTRFVYALERPGAFAAGNVTTGPGGNFTVPFAVPSDWRAGERLAIRVLTPEGEETASVTFGTGSLPFTRRLPLNATFDPQARRVGLSANYTGAESLDGTSMVAMLIPGGDAAFGSRAGGKPLWAAMSRSGAAFTGSIEVPSWMPDGAYTVVVRLSNGGATDSAWDVVDAWNATAVAVTPAPAKPAPSPVFGGLVPGFELAGALAGVACAAFARRKVSR